MRLGISCKTTLRGAISIALILLASLPIASAQNNTASYIPPADAERILIIADSWSLVANDDSAIDLPTAGRGEEAIRCLEVKHQNQEFRWPIDIFRLADRINSNSICSGQHVEQMQSYLNNLKSKNSTSPVLVQLVSAYTGGPLSVSGIWPFDYRQSWNKSIQTGSTLLGMSAKSVKELGSAGVYRKKMEELSLVGWTKITKQQKLPPPKDNRIQVKY